MEPCVTLTSLQGPLPQSPVPKCSQCRILTRCLAAQCREIRECSNPSREVVEHEGHKPLDFPQEARGFLYPDKPQQNKTGSANYGAQRVRTPNFHVTPHNAICDEEPARVLGSHRQGNVWSRSRDLRKTRLILDNFTVYTHTL